MQHLARSGANPIFTVGDVTFVCGISSPTLLQGDSRAKQISGEVFDDDFMSFMYKIVKELDNYLKSYSTLTAANGQIRLNPGQKRILKNNTVG